jgi:hypothetical protein
MLDVLYRQVELVLMPVGIPAELGAPVRQDSLQRQPWASKNGTTRSLSRSAAVTGVWRSYSLAKATLL